MEGIKEVMVKEHAKIAILLEKLEADIANNQEARKDFQELRSYMKQHFYIEDDAIFSIFSNMNDKEVSSIFDLMQEHGLILGDLNDVEKAITKNLPVDLIKLKKDMKEHFEIEEKFFYPTLEKELNENQKSFIVMKVHEISKRQSEKPAHK